MAYLALLLKFVDLCSEHFRIFLESPWQTSEIVGDPFSKNAWKRSYDLRAKFGKSSEIFGKLLKTSLVGYLEI